MATNTNDARGAGATDHAHDLKVGEMVVILTPEEKMWVRLDLVGFDPADVERINERTDSLMGALSWQVPSVKLAGLSGVKVS